MRRKLRSLADRVPRGARIAGNVLLAALAIFLCYLLAGAPAFSPEQAFRRAEAAHLVGPGTLLGTVDAEAGRSLGYDRLLLADEGAGVALYTCRTRAGSSSEAGRLIWREKTDGVTVVPAPAHALTFTGERAALPVVVFDEFPKAVRAELALHLYLPDPAAPGGVGPSMELRLAAERTGPGYFVFTAGYEGSGQRSDGVQMINALGSTSQDNERSLISAFPATVRLYGADGALLCEAARVIRTRAGYAAARDGRLPAATPD
jgi:hypothetical protein